MKRDLAQVPECESPGTGGRRCRHSDPGPSHPGQMVEPASPRTRSRVVRDKWTLHELGHGRESLRQLVDPAVPRTMARVARDSWWTPQDFGPGPVSPGTAGRPGSPSDQGLNCPGQLVDTAGPLEQAQFSRDSWSTPPALGQGPKSPGTDVPPHRPWDRRPSRPGNLIYTTAKVHCHESPGSAVQRAG